MVCEKVCKMSNRTISLTFGDAGENHVGMEMIGEKGEKGEGFTCDELQRLTSALGGEYVSLGNNASIAIFRQIIDVPVQNRMLDELSFDWDNKYYDTRRSRVLNKLARHNVLFMEGVERAPDYENKCGSIIDSSKLVCFSEVKRDLFEKFSRVIGGKKFENIICEGNLYYDNSKCGIGFHGDKERVRVIALRLGKEMKMKWQWFQNSVPVFGEELVSYETVFDGGDLYIMSEKAVGSDWMSRNHLTLRHSAGCDKYTVYKPKPAKKKAVKAAKSAKV